MAGVTSGNLGYALKAGLIAGVTAIANFGVGTFTKGLGDVGYLMNAAGRALVGCGSAVASGGKCGSGALAAGVTALAGPLTNGHGLFADLVMNSTVGGLASVAGGGKFANGAVTGAFGYLFSPAAGAASDAYACGPACPAIVGGAAVSDALFGTALMATVFGWLAAIGVMLTPNDPYYTPYHGTDLDSAGDIVRNGLSVSAAKQVGGGDLFWTTTSLNDAKWFAAANPSDGPPAVVQMDVPSSVMDGLRTSGQLSVAGSVYMFAAPAWPTLNRTATFSIVP